METKIHAVNSLTAVLAGASNAAALLALTAVRVKIARKTTGNPAKTQS